MRGVDRKRVIPIIFATVEKKSASLVSFTKSDDSKTREYRVIQQTYLKESVSHMFFSCLTGMQRFVSHRGMEQFKEIVEIVLAEERDNQTAVEIFG